MTIQNAIRKLERKGWKVSRNTGPYTASKEGIYYRITFLPNGSDAPENSIVCLRVTHITDHDDFQSDYFAGHYMDSMTQAIGYAEGIWPPKPQVAA